ncbi:hypothetical protein AB0M57_25410 [Streptomyces sp. NPDC051597]|uniref:hypothetical protein n=1 Tax=Streptomyces sp. NPDC051597 TaxID=3155049 RepID=UPI0034430AFB
MPVLMLVFATFAVVGLFGLVLITDFRGVRSWFEAEGDPDAYTRIWRRHVRLGFAWMAVFGFVYGIIGFTVRFAIRASRESTRRRLCAAPS